MLKLGFHSIPGFLKLKNLIPIMIVYMYHNKNSYLGFSLNTNYELFLLTILLIPNV